MRWLDSIRDSVDMDLGKLWEIMREVRAGCSRWDGKESDTT